MDTVSLVNRLLDVIERDIAPKTRAEVQRGNKLFGAAILRKADLSVVIAETNNEVENPIWHGEMHAIRRFYELSREERPAPSECLFLCTHEPCSLCLSGITWSGFDNFYYLFSHEQTRDSFAIPHDIRILREVFAVPDPDRASAPPERPLYNAQNAFFAAHGIEQLVASLDRGNKESLLERIDNVSALYADLSAAYQARKGAADIPLA